MIFLQHTVQEKEGEKQFRTADDQESRFFVAFYRLLGKKTVAFFLFPFFPPPVLD